MILPELCTVTSTPRCFFCAAARTGTIFLGGIPYEQHVHPFQHPPPDRGRRRDGGVVQGARHSRLRRERCGEAVNADDMPVIFYAVYRQNFSCL